MPVYMLLCACVLCGIDGVRQRQRHVCLQGPGSKRGPPRGAHTGPNSKRQNKQAGGWAPEGPTAAQRKPCLLHRLVAGDVRQDRSLLLQAIRCARTAPLPPTCPTRAQLPMQRAPPGAVRVWCVCRYCRSERCMCRFFVANNYLQDVDVENLHFPERSGR